MNDLRVDRKRRAAEALVVAGVPLLIYTLTLAPSVTLEDSGEYVSVAKTLSLAHPPGVPLWCLLAHGMTRLPFGEVAQRTNFLSALCGALASLFLYFCAKRWTLRWDVALAAAWTAAFTRTIWGQSVVTEVYTLNLAMVFLCLLLAEKWRESGGGKWLVATAFAGGLGACNHHLLILLSPVVIARCVVGRFLRIVRDPKLIFACLLALAAGLSVYLYLPIRSAQSPPILWETVDSWNSFRRYITRAIYKEAGEGLWYSGTPADSFRFLLTFLKNLPFEQSAVGFLAIPGLYGIWKRNRGAFGVVAGVLFVNLPVLLFIGGSVFTETSEYINRLYYLPALAAVAVCTAMGWTMAIERIAGRLSRKIRAALVLSICLVPLSLNWKACDRSDYWIAHEYGENLLRCLPEESAVFPLTNNEGFLIMYYQQVLEDPRAWLLDQRYGWDGKRMPKAVYTLWDIGKSAVSPLGPPLADRETVPETLFYRVTNRPPEAEPAQKYLGIRPVELTIESRPEEYPYLSPFERMIFASYSNYYARLGAKLHHLGRTDEAERSWELAEDLNPGDSFSHFLLAEIYEEAETRSGHEIARHLRLALETFDSCYDPLDTRFYGVTKRLIEARLHVYEHSLVK